MTTLFLLGATWDEVPSLIATLKEQEAKGNTIILALDFWAGKKLREASISYKVPLNYLDPSTCRDLDASAADLARNWYKTLGDRLRYDGISLGQIAELDFVFLFIDALRSAKIARQVLSEHKPDKVLLAGSVSFPEGNPNSICHESLPGIVAHLAREQGVPVTWAEPPSSTRYDIPPKGNSPRGRGTLRQLVRDGLELARRGFEMSTTLVSSLVTGGHDTVVFVGVPFYPRIAAALDADGPRGLNLRPTRARWTKARLRARPIQKLWHELKEDIPFREALTYAGISLSEVLDRRFYEFFQERVPELIDYIEGTDWILRRVRPTMLVVLEDVSPISRAICQKFKQDGLPVLVLQHGAVSGDIGGFYVMPVEADRSAVWGRMVRDLQIKRGTPESSLVVTGNPGFDLIAGGHDPPEARIRRRLGLRRDGGIILVATEWFTGTSSAATVEGEEHFIRYTLRALQHFPHHQVVVKLHPNYQVAYERLVRAIAEEEGLQVTIAKDDLWDLLAICDLSLVSNSTVGIEAMILGKPVIVVHAYEGIEEIPYVASGAALGASKPEEIVSALAQAMDEVRVREEMAEARKTFVREYAHVQDGRATERVANLIGRLVRSASPEGRATDDLPDTR